MTIWTNRRTFTAGALALAAAPGGARAQVRGRPVRLSLGHATFPASVMTEDGHPYFSALLGALRKLGWIEGQTLTVERWSFAGQVARYPELARAVMAANPDIVVSSGFAVIRVLQAASATIPIVVAAVADPIGAGLVPSLARPGGNVTGMATLAGTEIYGKQLELLHEALPRAVRVGYLASQAGWDGTIGAAARGAGKVLGLTLIGAPVSEAVDEAEYRRAFGTLRQAGAEALAMTTEVENSGNRGLIARLALEAQLPMMHGFPESAAEGGLIGYGPNLAEAYRRSADYVDKIIKGAKPGDLPMQQLERYELSVNLKTAMALGLKLPESFLMRANEVIE